VTIFSSHKLLGPLIELLLYHSLFESLPNGRELIKHALHLFQLSCFSWAGNFIVYIPARIRAE
jgi:hypothetical protein